MENISVLCLMGAGYALIVSVCLKFLPGERWQILATVPMKRLDDHTWLGINLTWYGFFLATAVVVASLLFLVLMISLQIPCWETVLFLLTLLAICLPAAKLVARIVEKKKHTLTVGGASFVGLLAAPGVLILANSFFPVEIPILPAMAAMAVAYALGEGLGRIACVSFGCCYGKSLESCRPWLRNLFRRWPAVFLGPMKKAAYEGKMEGEPLVPVQAISSLVNGTLFAAGAVLFSMGRFFEAMSICLIGTQFWRTLSEFFRADYRGRSRISTYQAMSLGAMIFTIVLCFLLPDSYPAMLLLSDALLSLWSPFTLLFVQGLWLLVFVYTGRSMVTGATLQFHIHRHLI
ncbi:MAG: prolipoprotein diacylglyceryl transferase family protein [Desulfobulbaceae bacterium]